MGAFDAIDIAATGATVSHDWLDVIAHNLANVNTATHPDEEPFRASLVYAQERIGGPGVSGSGVARVGLIASPGEPKLVYSPEHPLADDEGFVAFPVVDIATQMSDLIIAQRSYQMNLEVVRNSRDAYEAALRIGRA